MDGQAASKRIIKVMLTAQTISLFLFYLFIANVKIHWGGGGGGGKKELAAALVANFCFRTMISSQI